MKLKQFKHELRGNYNCDKWGEVMSAWFECSAHLWMKGAAIPAEWQYTPGMTDNPTDQENDNEVMRYWTYSLNPIQMKQYIRVDNAYNWLIADKRYMVGYFIGRILK